MIEVALIDLEPMDAARFIAALRLIETRAKVTAVCAADAARLEVLASEFGLAPENRFEDWVELLRRARMDAVAIAAPPPQMELIAAAAARAGNHVVCQALPGEDGEGEQRIEDALERGLVAALALPCAAAPDAEADAERLCGFIDYLETGLA